jgi:glycosyltransferase involved in cell wall biosynthesis
MKILVTASQTPFIHGGADDFTSGVCQGLRGCGHEVELLRFPFSFFPEQAIEELMDHCAFLDLNRPNGMRIDRVISMQFPGYGIRHDQHRAWIMHQHRPVYELFDNKNATAAQQDLRDKIIAYDNRVLPRLRKIFTISTRVAARLKKNNNLKATPLYHPPPGAALFFKADSWDYIFCPSRIESLKRQELLIRAAALMKSDLRIIIAGVGGQLQYCQQLAAELGVGNRVIFVGRVSEAEKRSWYAHCLAVFFGPVDEDYGYVTLEAMLAAKPVITCHDSGGVLEFVEDKVTGLIVEPHPETVAAALEEIYADKPRAALLGDRGREAWAAMDITWEKAIEKLLR